MRYKGINNTDGGKGRAKRAYHKATRRRGKSIRRAYVGRRVYPVLEYADYYRLQREKQHEIRENATVGMAVVAYIPGQYGRSARYVAGEIVRVTKTQVTAWFPEGGVGYEEVRYLRRSCEEYGYATDRFQQGSNLYAYDERLINHWDRWAESAAERKRKDRLARALRRVNWRNVDNGALERIARLAGVSVD